MLELQLHWVIVLLFSLFIATYLLYLYLKEYDKRKLTFSIALYLSSITHIGLSLGLITLNFGESISPLSYNVFSLTSFPLLYAIILSVHEPLIKIKNYDEVFYPFLLVSVGTLSLVFLPFKLTILSYFYLIVSLEVVPVILYLFYKYRSLENLYFFFFLCCSAIGGIGRTYDYGYLSAFSFFLGYVFIGLLFVQKATAKSGKNKGISRYFLLEQKLKSAEKRYEQLFNSMPESISVLSEKGRILDTNDYYADSINIQKNEIIGKNIRDFLSEPVYADRINAAKKALETGKIQTNEDQNDGMYFSNTFIPVQIDEDTTNLLFVSKDITEKVIVSEEKEKRIKDLRKTELATLSIMEDMQESNEKLEHAKKEIEDKNEELRNNMEEMQILNQELNVTREQLMDLNENLEEKVEERTRELEEKTTNLEQVNMELIKTEKEREKIIIELVKKTDENDRLLKQKEDFINQLGHDLRTPLTPMLGLLPLLKKRITDEKGLTYISMIDRNIRFMKDLVNKTITFAKLNSDKIEFLFSEINLNDHIKNVQHLLHVTLEKEQAQLDIHIDSNSVVFADETQLTEVFHNLISNSLKYAQKEIQTRIEISAEKTHEDIITVRVSDNGIGMTQEQIKYAFDEFYKADDARTDIDSHGLGLNICKRIIEKHGGKIWVESEGPGKGSQFIFTLHITNGSWNSQYNEDSNKKDERITTSPTVQ